MTDDINQRNPELPNTVAGLKQRAESAEAEAALWKKRHDLLCRLNYPSQGDDFDAWAEEAEAAREHAWGPQNIELGNKLAARVTGLIGFLRNERAEAAAFRTALITRTAHLSSMTGPRPVCLACNKMGEQSGTEIPHAPDCIVADSSTAGARLLAERKRLRESARLTQDYFDDTLHGTIQFSEEEQKRVFQAAVDALAVPGETNE